MKDKRALVMRSLSLFSKIIIGLPLRPYQIGPADAVIESCINSRGLEFLWLFPRQSGKDEAVAQMVTYLLTIFYKEEVGLVHTYPTKGQLTTGIDRLESRLDNEYLQGRWWSKGSPTRRGVGKSQIAFFSAHPQARAEGATANLLLIVNEVQDCDETTIERRFTPMRASTNATALYVGTVRTRNDYLWKVKTRLERQQTEDGIRRVFIISPDEVGASNQAYKAFIEGQIKAKGRYHPAVRTELFNEPLDVAAGLFPPRRRALMRGQHSRERHPLSGVVYLALVDVGGQDEAATSAFAELDSPGRDYTVCTIVRVSRNENLVGPEYEVVDVIEWQGVRHFQDMPGQASLFNQLVYYLNRWEPTAVIVDSTGVGQGMYDALQNSYKRQVFGFDFSGGRKARLGNDFLAIVETGRFRYFREATDDTQSDEWFFFLQCEHCGYELAVGQPIERGLRWGVEANTKAQMPNGSVMLVHDDRLLSAALVAEADRLYREGLLFLMTGESAVINRDIIGEVDEGDWN